MFRWSLLVAASCLSCVSEAPARVSHAAVPIKSACTASSRPAAAMGLDVRSGRRHSEAQTIFVTNSSDEARTVHVDQVSRVEGPCSGDWARQTPLNFVDAATAAPPESVTLAPGQALQLRIGAQRVSGTWECTKLGLALWMKVGDDVVCGDSGAWIGAGDPDDD
jgi:hypothetical protein